MLLFGGPSGGDGGDGGNVVFMVDEGKTTLLDLRYNQKICAEAGGKGKTKENSMGQEVLTVL